MTLLVDVLARSPLPVVRAIVSGVPAGASWSLHGVSGRDEWLVASGTSSGAEVVTADPWAPVGPAVSYLLRYGAVVETAGPVVRPYEGRSAVTDLTGRVVADVLLMKGGGDQRDSERRAHFSEVRGARFSPARLDPVAGAGGGSLTVRAANPDAAVLEGLLASNRPLVVLHNEQRCQARDCVIAPARTVYVTSDSNDVTSRSDRGEREWSLSYRLMPSGVVGGTVPVVDLADVKAAFATLADLKAAVPTLGALVRGDWLIG